MVTWESNLTKRFYRYESTHEAVKPDMDGLFRSSIFYAVGKKNKQKF